MPLITLNRRVVFEKRTVTQDELGQEQETWTTARVMWADRRDMSGEERVRSDQQLAIRVAVFTVRWFAGLNAADWRIKHDYTYDSDGTAVDLIWDIQGISEPRNTRKQYWELLCSAVRV